MEASKIFHFVINKNAISCNHGGFRPLSFMETEEDVS